jgi:hypothetical protein
MANCEQWEAEVRRLQEIIKVHEEANAEVKGELARVSRLAMLQNESAQGASELTRRIRELEESLAFEREVNRSLKLAKTASARLMDRVELHSQQTTALILKLLEKARDSNDQGNRSAVARRL